MGTSSTVAAVLIGFLSTSKAIVLSVTDSAVFRSLKQAGYTNRLYLYLYESVLLGSLFLVLSLVGFFLPEGRPPPWFTALWILVGGIAILMYGRTAKLLFDLVRKA